MLEADRLPDPVAVARKWSAPRIKALYRIIQGL